MSEALGESPQPANQPPDPDVYSFGPGGVNPNDLWLQNAPADEMPYIVPPTDRPSSFGIKRGMTPEQSRARIAQRNENNKYKQRGHEFLARPITNLVDDASVVFRGIDRVSGQEKVGGFKRTVAAIHALGKVSLGLVVANILLPQAGEMLDEHGEALNAGINQIPGFEEVDFSIPEVDISPYALPATLAIGGLIALFGRYRQNTKTSGEPWYKFNMDRLRPVTLKRSQADKPHSHIRKVNPYVQGAEPKGYEAPDGDDGGSPSGRWGKFRQFISDNGGVRAVAGELIDTAKDEWRKGTAGGRPPKAPKVPKKVKTPRAPRSRRGGGDDERPPVRERRT